MRPIQRGDAPGSPINQYRQAASLLREQLGTYCSFCERPILTHLAVEHVQSQSKHPALVLDWTNFLLACVNCNSCKREHNDSRVGYLWPDANNTLLALNYRHGVVHNALPADHAAYPLADALIRLIGLDKVPGHPDPKRKPSKDDDRWNYRRQLADSVLGSKKRLAQNDIPAMRDEIIERAKDRGGFSIWFAIFQDDADMRQRLIAAFPGTAQDCFDKTALPIIKPGQIL